MSPATSARRLSSRRAVAMLVAAALAAAVGGVTYGAGAWSRAENDTIDLRFQVRGAQATPQDVVVVSIDDRTFDELGLRWPFPRRLDADVIRTLHADGAKVIAYDLQFTERSNPSDDRGLFHAVGTARNVVLATTPVNARAPVDVRRGAANPHQGHAIAAAANIPVDTGGVMRTYPYRMRGLPSFAAAAARVAGDPVNPAEFRHGSALIDFRGPPGTIQTYSFSDVLRGRVNPEAFAGKVVVVGATAPPLEDAHPTPTSGSGSMSGAEIQANAIWTALHGNPLAAGPAWLAWLAIVLCAGAAPLASLRLRVPFAALAGSLLTAAYLGLTQLAFGAGTVLSVSYPVTAWILGTVGMVAGNYAAVAAERNAFARQLAASQLELVQRLAQAVESRDSETGEHVHRLGSLCRRLALQIGWSAADAEMIMHASIAHDVGKIGISDSILLKAGPLDEAEWEIIKTHTTIGADLLHGSPSPLIQMAETMAISHHERWDGGGYPHGLRGEEIPVAGRICAIADVYDALLSERRHKEAWDPEDVLDEIARGSGTHFDPQLVDAFLQLAPGLIAELEASFTREEAPPAAPRTRARSSA